MYWYFRPTLRHLSGYPAIRGTNGSYPSGDEHQGGEDPLPCPPRARTRQKPGTLTRCPAPANPQLTRKAAVGHWPPYDLLSGRPRVRVGFRAQVIYEPRRLTDEPPGKGGAFAPVRRDDEHQGDEHLENGPRGGSRPRTPRVWLRSPRFFTPYRPTRTRQDLPCTSAGNPAPPSPGHQRAIRPGNQRFATVISRHLATQVSLHRSLDRSDSQADSADLTVE